MNSMADMIQTVARTDESSAPKQPGRIKRFTIDGSDELEQHLEWACQRVAIEIQKRVSRRKLQALLLGGGYGRGEGGVLKTSAGDRPYNDLEFYVFLRGNNVLNERRFKTTLHQLAHELSPEMGVEVEFKITSSAKLRRSPTSMFYYDLIMGHRLIFGTEPLSNGCEHHRDASKIPQSEATRLLMNRCSGLLFAREKLKAGMANEEDVDFVVRNLAKAQLAFGDAVLTAFGQYHWSCRERHRRLTRLSADGVPPWLDEVRRHHAAGVEFKLHPCRPQTSIGDLQSRHKEITAFALKVWLWLENRRLGCRFESAHDYALSPVNKFPGSNPWRNCMLNAKAFGPAFAFRNSCHRYPREKIINALALLLWGDINDRSGLEHQFKPIRLSADYASAKQIETYQTFWSQLN
jgi:hypothetical protein